MNKNNTSKVEFDRAEVTETMHRVGGIDFPNDVMRFHKRDGNGNITGIKNYEVVNWIKEKGLFFSVRDFDGWYFTYWDGSFHRESGKMPYLKKIIGELTYEEIYTTRAGREICERLEEMLDLTVPVDEMDKHDPEQICFSNGIYDPRTGEISDYDSNLRFINKIDRVYDPDNPPADDGFIDTWLNGLVPDPGDREMLLQYCGLCFGIDTRPQKFLIIKGAAGTGKSRLLELLKHCIGCSNYSSIGIESLSDRFKTSALIGKTLNGYAEIRRGTIIDPQIAKLIAGADDVDIEAKFKDPISLKLKAKLLYMCNEFPQIKNENTNGLFRRLLIIACNNKPSEIDTDLESKLFARSDVFVDLCMRALHRLYVDHNGAIAESENSKRMVRKLRMDCDSVEDWLYHATVEGSDYWIKKTDAFNSYTAYCLREGIENRIVKSKAFYNIMEESKNYKADHKRVGDVFLGFRLKDTEQDTGPILKDGRIKLT